MWPSLFVCISLQCFMGLGGWKSLWLMEWNQYYKVRSGLPYFHQCEPCTLQPRPKKEKRSSYCASYHEWAPPTSRQLHWYKKRHLAVGDTFSYTEYHFAESRRLFGHTWRRKQFIPGKRGNRTEKESWVRKRALQMLYSTAYPGGIWFQIQVTKLLKMS